MFTKQAKFKQSLAAIAISAISVISNVSASESKTIGLIDTSRMDKTISSLSHIENYLKENIESMQNEMLSIENDLAKLRKQQESGAITKSAFDQSMKKIQEKAMTKQTELQKKYGKLEAVKVTCGNEFTSKLKGFVSKVANEKKLKMVLSSALVIFSNDSEIEDITDSVTDHFNKAFKSVSIDAEKNTCTFKKK